MIGSRLRSQVAVGEHLNVSSATRRGACWRTGSHLLPRVSGDAKAEFLARLDVLVMPSAYECFGVVAIEALAAGTPVIVSDHVGVAPIVHGEQVGQVVQATVGSISAALRLYLEDRETCEAAAAHARAAAVEDPSFTAHGVRLANEYASIVSTRSAN